MMGPIQAYLRDILVVAVIGAILELMVPRSDSKRYVRLVVGLVILLAMLHPVVGLLRNGTAAGFAVPTGSVPREWAGLVQEGQALLRSNQQGILGQYQTAVTGQVQRLVAGMPGGKGAAVRVAVDQSPSSPNFGQVTAVGIVPAAPVNPPARQAMAAQVAGLLGISQSRVQVQGG